MIIHSLQQERNVYLRSQKCVSIFSNDSVFKFCLLRCYNNTYNEYNIYIYISMYRLYVIWFFEKSDYTIRFPSPLNLHVVGELVLIVSRNCTSEQLVGHVSSSGTGVLINWGTDGLIQKKVSFHFIPATLGSDRYQPLRSYSGVSVINIVVGSCGAGDGRGAAAVMSCLKGH